MSMQQGKTDAQASPECEKEYMGRTIKEWVAFLPALGSVVLIVFGVLHVSDCSGIPSLPAFCIIFGTLCIVNGAIPLAFRIEKAKAAGSDGGAATHVVSFIGLSIIGCAIWGAVITWGETSRFGNSPDCNPNLYSAGFISSVIPLAIIAVVLLGFIFKMILLSGRDSVMKKTEGHNAEDGQEGKDVQKGKEVDQSTAQEANVMAQP